MGIGANQRGVFLVLIRAAVSTGWGWAVLFLVSLVGAGWAGGTGLVDPKPLTIIKNAALQPHRQPPVSFRHAKHEAAKVACAACHHDYQDGRNRWRQGQPVRPCGACHKPVAEAGKPDLKTAYHRQCKDCHRRRQQEQRSAGPVKCRECHRLL